MIRVSIPQNGAGLSGVVRMPASKSISARLLVLDALYGGESSSVSGLAVCDDTEVLRESLAKLTKTGLRTKTKTKTKTVLPLETSAEGAETCAKRNETAPLVHETAAGLKPLEASPLVLDLHGAGTAMRFLTAVCACMEGTDVVLTGCERMCQRPIKELVEVLQGMGADIEYLGLEGCPPLHIVGHRLCAPDGALTMDASVSSQFVSALLMTAPLLGLRQLTLTGRISSKPYIEMTMALMAHYGLKAAWDDDERMIMISGEPVAPEAPITVEGDWSAASYWLAMRAVAAKKELPWEVTLEGLVHPSVQGDSECAYLLPPRQMLYGEVCMDCSAFPDLIQTLAVAWCLFDIPFHIYGAESLRVKETDRVAALVAELGTLGFVIHVKESEWRGQQEVTLWWDGTKDFSRTDPDTVPTIRTYGDHRMAMAFTPAALVHKAIIIDEPEVVGKSYPTFWDDLRTVGFNVNEE